MMGEQKSGDQSHEMMQGMKEMMAGMSRTIDMCSHNGLPAGRTACGPICETVRLSSARELAN
jgi:hypothetical protein